MEEELICTSCSSTWKRAKVRGRKPLLCPTCISGQIQHNNVDQPVVVSNSKDSIIPLDLSVSKIHTQLHPKPSNYQELKESTKNGSVWKCPGCGSILEMFLALTAIPTHRCTPNTITLKIMERIS